MLHQAAIAATPQQGSVIGGMFIMLTVVHSGPMLIGAVIGGILA